MIDGMVLMCYSILVVVMEIVLIEMTGVEPALCRKDGLSCDARSSVTLSWMEVILAMAMAMTMVMMAVWMWSWTDSVIDRVSVISVVSSDVGLVYDVSSTSLVM